MESTTGTNWQMILAIVGASAWIPHLIKFFYSLLVKPKLSFIPNKVIEIGYTPLGPLINPSFGISASKKNALIEDVYLDVTHETGASCEFKWESTKETGFQIETASGDIQYAKRLQIAALKIPINNLIEKTILFQSINYKKRRIADQEIIERIAESIKRKNLSVFPDSMFIEKEWLERDLYLKTEMFWKKGRYEAVLRVIDKVTKKAHTEKYVFELTQHHINILENNIDKGKEYLKNIFRISSGISIPPPSPTWSWIYPEFKRDDSTPTRNK